MLVLLPNAVVLPNPPVPDPNAPLPNSVEAGFTLNNPPGVIPLAPKAPGVLALLVPDSSLLVSVPGVPEPNVPEPWFVLDPKPKGE